MKQIINIASYITAVATIAGAALWFDGKFDTVADNNKIILDSVAELRQELFYINVEQSFIAEDISAIHDTLEDMNTGIQDNTKTNNRLIWMERNREEFTPDQMKLLLDDWLKKNEIALESMK